MARTPPIPDRSPGSLETRPPLGVIVNIKGTAMKMIRLPKHIKEHLTDPHPTLCRAYSS